jgi:hypothetical protein
MEICPKCGGSKYTDALKVYNKGKPAWCMPRKGTESHAEVLRIMNTPKKPTRKLRKTPEESVTNLGQEGRKRIEEFTDTKPIINKMEVAKKPTRKLRKAPVKEQPKKWYEHKLWSNGTYRFELDPVMRPGKTYFFKNLTSEEEQKQRGEIIVSPGFNMRPNKDGLPTKSFLSKFKPV